MKLLGTLNLAKPFGLKKLKDRIKYLENCLKNETEKFHKETLNTSKLITRMRKLTEALTAIASLDKKKHEKEEYWLKITHEQCATVLATDTKIARKALKDVS